MSDLKKFIRAGYSVDAETLSFKTRHKSRIVKDYKVSDCHILIDKKQYLFHNDNVFVFDYASDFEKDYGINKMARSFDGNFDDFKDDFYFYYDE